jgi:HK97 family phage major capsid protein/HK97 family phage prohead protease
MKEVRAYSLLEVKQFDERTGRKFSGIATTPTPDRMQDVIDPMGVKFNNPMPMLLFHQNTMPVGVVTFGKPTKKGIPFEAEIPTVVEEGEVKKLTDKAAHFVKYGLIRAVSIGFRVLEDAYEFIEDTGGILFKSTECLELSLVPVPAQAEATINVVKSIVGGSTDRAALGIRSAAKPTPGASGSTRNKNMKTIQEQITAYEAKRQAHTARMTELMTKSGETGETLNEEETQEYDGLRSEVKSVDAHLVRLREMEELNKAAAKPAAGSTDEEGSRSRGGFQVVHVKDNLPPGIEFARYAMCIAAAKGNTHQALAIAKARYPDQGRIQMVLKAAVEAGTTTDPVWAGSLVQYTQYAGDFVEFLRPQTIVGKFGTGGIPSLRRVPFNVMIKGQTSGGNGYWVGQGRPKPLTKFDFEPMTLRWAKVANIAVITEELARFSSPSAEQLVRDALAGAIIERMDIDFVDPDKAEVSDVSPASITNGVTPIPSSGSSTAHITADVAAAMGTFIGANITPTTGVWIMSATTALALSLRRNALGQKEYPDISMNGGTFEGLPVIVSQYLALVGSPTNEIVILANANDIYLADDGQVVIDVSREASLEMSDTPTNASAAGSPLAPVPTQLVSLWQSNSIGLRAERFVNWKKRRAAAVSYISGVNWASGASPI